VGGGRVRSNVPLPVSHARCHYSTVHGIRTATTPEQARPLHDSLARAGRRAQTFRRSADRGLDLHFRLIEGMIRGPRQRTWKAARSSSGVGIDIDKGCSSSHRHHHGLADSHPCLAHSRIGLRKKSVGGTPRGDCGLHRFGAYTSRDFFRRPIRECAKHGLNRQPMMVTMRRTTSLIDVNSPHPNSIVQPSTSAAVAARIMPSMTSEM